MMEICILDRQWQGKESGLARQALYARENLTKGATLLSRKLPKLMVKGGIYCE
jgi:hypothetical protein